MAIKYYRVERFPHWHLVEIPRESNKPKGYHINDIQKGRIGEPSKILEEAHEFIDACEQGSSIMALIELSDLYGAMEHYLNKHHPTVTMADLETMASITKRAFDSGRRT